MTSLTSVDAIAAALAAERLQIARQLHDHFAQKLSIVSMRLFLLDGDLQCAEIPWNEVRLSVASLQNIVQELGDASRKMERELMPAPENRLSESWRNQASPQP